MNFGFRTEPSVLQRSVFLFPPCNVTRGVYVLRSSDTYRAETAFGCCGRSDIFLKLSISASTLGGGPDTVNEPRWRCCLRRERFSGNYRSHVRAVSRIWHAAFPAVFESSARRIFEIFHRATTFVATLVFFACLSPTTTTRSGQRNGGRGEIKKPA